MDLEQLSPECFTTVLNYLEDIEICLVQRTCVHLFNDLGGIYNVNETNSLLQAYIEYETKRIRDEMEQQAIFDMIDAMYDDGYHSD